MIDLFHIVSIQKITANRPYIGHHSDFWKLVYVFGRNCCRLLSILLHCAHQQLPLNIPAAILRHLHPVVMGSKPVYYTEQCIVARIVFIENDPIPI